MSKDWLEVAKEVEEFRVSIGIKRRAQLEIMDNSDLLEFIWDMDRAERLQNSKCFIKGIRACLYALGYSDELVNDRLYSLMLETWED